MAQENPLAASLRLQQFLKWVVGPILAVALVVWLAFWGIPLILAALRPATFTLEDVPIVTSNGLAVSNTPRHGSMKLQRGSPKINGDLSEWRLEDGFVTAPDRLNADGNAAALSPKEGESELKLLRHFFGVRGMMMEDAENLYIAAKIGDPQKTMIGNEKPKVVKNLDDAETPSNYIQVRYSSDSDEKTKSPKRAFEIHLWYSPTKEKAYLGIHPAIAGQGPEKRTILTGDDGFQCVFKQVGFDCIVEAKIPWALIRRPAPDTKEINCIWQVIRHAGNPKIRLVELVNLNHDGLSKMLSSEISTIGSANGIERWGKLIRQTK